MMFIYIIIIYIIYKICKIGNNLTDNKASDAQKVEILSKIRNFHINCIQNK